MRIAQTSFRGEAPRVAPEGLPANAAQAAINAKLLTGNLEAWRQFVSAKALANAGPVLTIYLLNGAWLSWDDDVDVARGTDAGDTTYRTYLTSPGRAYSVPRFTNYALATTGAEPYPVATRPLGVPGPDTAPTLVTGTDSTPTSFDIDVTDDNASLEELWTINAQRTGALGSAYATVTQDAGFYHVIYDSQSAGQDAFGYRNFGVAGATTLDVSAKFVFPSAGDDDVTTAFLVVAADSSGAGICAGYSENQGDGDPARLSIRKSSAWSSRFGVEVLESTTLTDIPADDQERTLRVQAVKQEDGTKLVTATIYDVDGTTVLATLTTRNTFSDGDYCGFTNATTAVGSTLPRFETDYLDYHVQATGSTNYVPINIATAYVYTFVNDLGQESAPSPASVTIQRPDGVSVTVTTPTTTVYNPDYVITHKRIYRAVTGVSGTVYRFVAEITLATADYVDEQDDSELSEDVLETTEYDLPPDDLDGIIALPNGIMAGFSKNQLCLSAKAQPHAWPVRARYPVDSLIVAINNVDNTVVIGTQTFVYTASGNDPFTYSMSKPGEAQSCTSKRSMQFLDGIGVVFASPDGLMACAGSASQVRNLTEALFTREQWQALDPTSILAAVHDGVYHFWHATGGYALDAKATGFGVIELAFHATAAHSAPENDDLYLVLDENDEPTDASLPLPSTAVTPDGLTIFAFDAHASAKMVYSYRGKLNLMPYPTTLVIARVAAADYTNLIVRFYGNGVQLLEKVISSKKEFVLPAKDTYETYEVELVGTSRVRLYVAGQEPSELAV